MSVLGHRISACKAWACPVTGRKVSAEGGGDAPPIGCTYPLDADAAELASTGLVANPLVMSEGFQKGTYTVGSGAVSSYDHGAHQSGLLTDFGDNGVIDNTMSVIPASGHKHLELFMEFPVLVSGADTALRLELLNNTANVVLQLTGQCGPSFMSHTILDGSGNTLFDSGSVAAAASLRVGYEFTPDGKIRIFDSISGDRGILQDSTGAADYVLPTGLLFPILRATDLNNMSGADPGKTSSIWMLTDASQQQLAYSVPAQGVC